MAPTNETYNPFLGDLTASQKFLTGDWFCIPEEGRIYNRFHDPILGTLSKGYRLIGTTFYGEKVNVMFHRAVWIGAHGGIIPDPGLQIDHVNGDKDDNRISNLRLVTAMENAHNPNAPVGKPGETHPQSVLSDAQRDEIVQRYEASRHMKKGEIGRVTTRTLAYEYRISHQQVSEIIRNWRKSNE